MKTGKIIIILSISIFLSSCDKYEFIDKNTRFNKRTGETETQYKDGKWMTKSQRIRYNEKLEEKRLTERQSKLLPFPYEEHKKVTGLGGYNKPYEYVDGVNFILHITNNSDWKIEEIDFQVRIHSKSDSSYLTTRKYTVSNYDENEGVPFSKTTYVKKDITKLEENQYNKWSIDQYRGYKY